MDINKIANNEETLQNACRNISNVLQSNKNDNCINKLQCIYCDMVFTRKDNLMKHMKERCKTKKNIQEEENNLTITKNIYNEIIENNKIFINKINKYESIINNLISEPKIKIKKEKIPQTLRFTIWEKYLGKNNEGKCLCCKNSTISITNFDCGHIVSNKEGGKIHIDNLKPICRLCNLSMGTMNMNDFMKKYGFDKNVNINVPVVI